MLFRRLAKAHRWLAHDRERAGINFCRSMRKAGSRDIAFSLASGASSLIVDPKKVISGYACVRQDGSECR